MTDTPTEADTATAAQTETSKLGVVLFGLDEQGKAHAATFEVQELDLALKAAELMGFQLFRLETEEQAKAVEGLPKGRIYATGKAFVPFIKRDVYERLLATVRPSGAGADAAPTAKAEPEGEGAASSSQAGGATALDGPAVTGPSEPETHPLKIAYGRPKAWDAVNAGDLVLAQESLSDGWWEAVVVEQEADLITLRWRDYPLLPKFIRHREGLALVNPNVT